MIRVALVALLLLSTAGCGLIIGASGQDRRTPLEKAAQEGNVAEVKRLLAAGANPNENDTATPPACPLCLAQNAEVVRALLAAGADPNGNAHNGMCFYQPFQQALYWGDLDSAGILLEAGASMETPCAKLIVRDLKPAVLDFLVQHGFNLQATDEEWKNYLHTTLAPPLVAPLETVEYLVRAGVPLNTRDRSGKTPLAYWRLPRYYEEHWLNTWINEHVFGRAYPGLQRELRAKMSAFLEQSGAVL